MVLGLLGSLQAREASRLARRHEFERRHDMRHDDTHDDDAIRLQRRTDPRAESLGVRFPQIEDLVGDLVAQQQPDDLLAGRLTDLVEIGRRDREHELLRGFDPERHEDVDARPHVVACRDLESRGHRKAFPAS